ncbi:MAG: Spy/CpxP family protein refolding chaperone [Sneathiella sp.]|nr:Spy/CpxP family protein refolding chaperone [Sneathiella sp.]
MKKILLVSATSLVLGALALSPASAHSNMQGGQMMGGGCPMMNMMDHGGMGPGSMQGGGMQGGMKQGGMMQGSAMGPSRMRSMAEGRLAFLKAELQIKADQEGVWKEYSDAVRNRMSGMQDMRTQMMKTMQDGNAIVRMDAHISGMQAMLDALKAVKPATTMLYEALSDEQKKIADQLIGLECGGM